MTPQGLLDAVIPVRLPAPYLVEAVRSLVEQQPAPHRIIIAAHGCADAIPASVGPYRDVVTVIDVPAHASLADVRNAGIDACDCAYVALLDSDDVARPGRLAAQMSALDEQNSAVLSASAVRLIDAGGRSVGTRYVYPFESDIRRLLITRNRIAQSSVTLRRAAFAQYRNVPLSEDYDLWLRMASSGDIAYTPSQLTDYRVHSGQLTSKRVVPPRAWLRILISRLALGRSTHVPTWKVLALHTLWCTYQSARAVILAISAAGTRRPGKRAAS